MILPKLFSLLFSAYSTFKPLPLNSEKSPLENLDFINLEDACTQIDSYLAGAIGYGGYLEKRTVYQRSEHFGADRNIHLGIDFFGPAAFPIKAPLAGKIHSFKNNDNPADYGPTIILEHAKGFYTLYGHLKLSDLEGINEGDFIERGQIFAHFGSVNENGGWPPHLHFQVIKNLEGSTGDYPGVCTEKDLAHFKNNCPNPITFFENIR
ncbi:MAG: peptidoglycan DD-metalloendopeptidase family protein [Luteibaculaceae bacterium]